MSNFESIFREYYPDVYTYVCFLSRDKAVVEDIVQDVFMVFYKKHAKLADHPCIKGWLFTTARNICWDYMKKIKRSKKYELELSAQALTEVYNIDIVPENIYETLSDFLSDEEIEFLKLNAEYGFTVKEISENKGFRYPAFRKRMWRLKEKIRKVWGDLYD